MLCQLPGNPPSNFLPSCSILLPVCVFLYCLLCILFHCKLSCVMNSVLDIDVGLDVLIFSLIWPSWLTWHWISRIPVLDGVVSILHLSLSGSPKVGWESSVCNCLPTPVYAIMHTSEMYLPFWQLHSGFRNVHNGCGHVKKITKWISLSSKIQLMCFLVTSIFLYACETWTLTSELQRRMQAMEMRCYSKILHISYKDHVTDKEVHARSSRQLDHMKISWRS